MRAGTRKSRSVRTPRTRFACSGSHPCGASTRKLSTSSRRSQQKGCWATFREDRTRQPDSESRCAVWFVLSVFALAAAPQPAVAGLLSDKFAARLLVPAYVFPDPAAGSAGRKYWDALVAAATPDC